MNLLSRPVFLLAPMSRIGSKYARIIADLCENPVATIDDERTSRSIHGVQRWSSGEFLRRAKQYPNALAIDFSASPQGHEWVASLCEKTGVERLSYKTVLEQAPVDDSVGAHDRARPLAFMHIPKSAGSSTTGMIAQTLNEAASMPMEHYFFGDVGPETFREDKKPKYQTVGTLPRDHRLVAGHLMLSTIKQAYPAAQIITLLREPVSRLLSLWVFWRSKSDDELSVWGEWGQRLALARNSLHAFLSDDRIAGNTDNVALRMLLAPHAKIDKLKFLNSGDGEDLLSAAIKRLNDFDFIDYVENPCLILNMEQYFGANIEVQTVNETNIISGEHKTVLERELDNQTLRLIENRTRFDATLWRMVVNTCTPRVDAEGLARKTGMRSVARFSRLLNGRDGA